MLAMLLFKKNKLKENRIGREVLISNQHFKNTVYVDKKIHFFFLSLSSDGNFHDFLLSLEVEWLISGNYGGQFQENSITAARLAQVHDKKVERAVLIQDKG